jgi:hypothetical protein
MGKMNFHDLYAGVKCPTLLVCSTLGTGNGISPLPTAAAAQEVVTSITNCKLYPVDGANHYTTIFEPPTGLMEEINNFVG